MTPKSNAARDIQQDDNILHCGLTYVVVRVEPAWHAPGALTLVATGPGNFSAAAQFVRRFTHQLHDAIPLSGAPHPFLCAPR
jgi:hypothetical protein